MQPLSDLSTAPIAVIGLGYVRLPLAVEFGRTRAVVGFDIDQARIGALGDGRDHTLKITSEKLVPRRACILPTTLRRWRTPKFSS